MIGTERAKIDGHKVYSLWDAYPHADLVTYPSTYEGFGNALLEAVYFKRLMVVNRYPVYNADIGPLGFDFVKLDGFVDEAAVEKTRDLLGDPQQVQWLSHGTPRQHSGGQGGIYRYHETRGSGGQSTVDGAGGEIEG